MEYKKIAIDYIGGEDYKEALIFKALETADDVYTNEGESDLSDAEYDLFYKMAKGEFPKNPFFVAVGSEVRGGKVTLPYPMGSLDQVEVGDIRSWIKKSKLVSNRSEIVITDKMDGISCELVYGGSGKLKAAYSRGDGIKGQDITRHIKRIPDVPKSVSGAMIIRAEIEFSDTNFEKIKKKVTRKSGEPFKNARNAAGGLMNGSKVNEVACQHLSVVTYEIMGSSETKWDQLDTMEIEGFHTVDAVLINDLSMITDKFLEETILDRKNELDYAIDGIVLEVNNKSDRDRLEEGNESLNPKSAIKYKIPDEDSIQDVKVEGVTWNISKHGKMKPIVNLVPTEIGGVTVSNATGFNAKFIQDNDIGKGAVVRLIRSGDVIPYILEIIKPAKQTSWPEGFGDLYWNDTEVDLIVDDAGSLPSVQKKRIVSWATSLDIENLKEGSVDKLFVAGFDTIESIVQSGEDELVNVVGKNGSKIFNSISDKLNGIELHVLLGSHPCFEMGIGEKKLKKLMPTLGDKIEKYINRKVKAPTLSEICAVDGFEVKSAQKVLDGLVDFIEFYGTVKKFIVISEQKKVVSTGVLAGKKVCMTGFRDKDLQAAAEGLGVTIQGSVSSKTDILVCIDKDSTSGKAKKARTLGVKILSKAEFEKMVA